MKYRTSHLLPRFFATGLLAFSFLAAMPGETAAALLTFSPSTPSVEVDFGALAEGSPVTTLPGWSGGSNIVSTAARDATHAPHAVVLSTTDSGNVTTTSPVYSPGLPAGTTVYFSAWINWSGSNSSNVRISLFDGDGLSLGAFGLASKQFGMAGTNGTWTYSSETIAANKWYELALVVDLDDTNPTASKGYLFVRDVSAGPDFRLLSGFESGVTMGYASGSDATHFANWSLQLRNNVQLDTLAVGVAIPEGRTASLLIGAGLVFAGLKTVRPGGAPRGQR